MRKLLLIAMVAVAATPTFGQGFPWEIFKPRTLKEVIAITTKAVRPDDSMFLATNQLESKVEVTYNGQSRPLIESRKKFRIRWSRHRDGLRHLRARDSADRPDQSAQRENPQPSFGSRH